MWSVVRFSSEAPLLNSSATVNSMEDVVQGAMKQDVQVKRQLAYIK